MTLPLFLPLISHGEPRCGLSLFVPLTLLRRGFVHSREIASTVAQEKIVRRTGTVKYLTSEANVVEDLEVVPDLFRNLRMNRRDETRREFPFYFRRRLSISGHFDERRIGNPRLFPSEMVAYREPLLRVSHWHSILKAYIDTSRSRWFNNF